MQYCSRCKTKMVEDYIVKLEKSNYHVVISDNINNNSDHEGVSTTRAAVCPKCGKVSIYATETDKLMNKSGNSGWLFIIVIAILIWAISITN